MSTKIDDTLHLKNFVDAINKADNSRQQEIKIDIEHAKRVRNALTSLLIHYAEVTSRKTEGSKVQDVNMDGGSFK